MERSFRRVTGYGRKTPDRCLNRDRRVPASAAAKPPRTRTSSGPSSLRLDRFYPGAGAETYYVFPDRLGRSDELRAYYQANRRYFSKSFVAYMDGLLDAKSQLTASGRNTRPGRFS